VLIPKWPSLLRMSLVTGIKFVKESVQVDKCVKNTDFLLRKSFMRLTIPLTTSCLVSRWPRIINIEESNAPKTTFYCGKERDKDRERE
jgi:hypothetical protein